MIGAVFLLEGGAEYPIGPTDSYLKRIRGGERLTPADYAGQYPQFAVRILERFPALELLEGLKPTPADRPGMRDDASVGVAPVAALGFPQKLSDYTLLREVGRGGMGMVYEAEHESLKNRVALKVMHPRFRADPTYLRRFQTEARSAARLHHTNIVSVFDFCEQDGVGHYAMQYIDGVGLDRVLDDIRRIRADAESASHPAMEGQGDSQATEPMGGRISAASRGLLTGRFATALGSPDGSAEAPTASLDLEQPERRGDYAEGRVPEYWIVNPQKETISVLHLSGDSYAEAGTYRRGETALSVLLSGFSVAVSAVFDAD